jgi:hypothetical protein
MESFQGLSEMLGSETHHASYQAYRSFSNCSRRTPRRSNPPLCRKPPPEIGTFPAQRYPRAIISSVIFIHLTLCHPYLHCYQSIVDEYLLRQKICSYCRLIASAEFLIDLYFNRTLVFGTKGCFQSCPTKRTRDAHIGSSSSSCQHRCRLV